MAEILEKEVEKTLQVPTWLLLVILIRIALTSLSFNIMGNVAEIIIFLLMVVPYLLCGIILYFNKKLGMKCSMIVSGIELLWDMATLLFNLHAFSIFEHAGLTGESGLFNTFFSSGVFLYVGTHWGGLLVNRLQDDIDDEPGSAKWYLNKRDALITLTVTTIAIFTYYYASHIEGFSSRYFFSWFALNLNIVAVAMILEGVLIGLKHYWKWMGTLAGILLVVAAIQGTGTELTILGVILVAFICSIAYGYGASMFAVASFVYVIRKNIGRKN